jgi:hypothetical protein
VEATKALLLQRKIKLYVLLTGDCVSDVSARVAEEEDIRAESVPSARAVFSELAEATGGAYVYMPGGTVQDYTSVLDSFLEDVVADVPEADTEPPTLSLSVTPKTLWPPNHKMVEISTATEAHDNLDPDPEVRLVGISSSEPEDIQGSGSTAPDYEVTPAGKIYVRAERSGAGLRRVYSITYEAVDDAGNKTVATAEVTVPHSQGK